MHDRLTVSHVDDTLRRSKMPRMCCARQMADIGKQVILSGEGRNFCGGIDLSVARSILKTVNDAQCPSRAREKLRRDILAMQVCSYSVSGRFRGAIDWRCEHAWCAVFSRLLHGWACS